MPTDTHEVRSPVFMAWGIPSVEAPEDMFGSAVWWVGGGASLLVWTALALLLTA